MSEIKAHSASQARARVCDPARICWLADVAYVVEEQHQAEYAGIVRLRKVPATRDEIEAWRFGGSTTTEGDE